MSRNLCKIRINLVKNNPQTSNTQQFTLQLNMWWQFTESILTVSILTVSFKMKNNFNFNDSLINILSLEQNKISYARPNGLYPRAYLHSKLNLGFLSFCWPLLLTFLSWEDCRSGALARSLQSVFSLEMSTIGPPKFQTNLVYILNVNSPCSNAHLVEHKSSFDDSWPMWGGQVVTV